jgi:hypothetical protein
MPRPYRLSATFLRDRSVVRGGLSAVIVLSLILFGVISFVWMVGLQPAPHDVLRIEKGNLSDNRISAQADHARR